MILKTPDEIEAMRAAGQIQAAVLEYARKLATPGIRLDLLDAYAETFIRDHGAVPANKGYRGYPKTLCIGIDEVAAHGIPDARELPADVVLTIDTGVLLDGWYSDAAITFWTGDEEPPEIAAFLDATHNALEDARAAAYPGEPLCGIGRAIENVAKAAGLSVVDNLAGHGIGRTYHEKPTVYNYDTGNKTRLRPGMVLAIEPILAQGRGEIFTHEDGWTVSTIDGSRVAQFEHVVAITEDGPEVLTELPAEPAEAAA